MGPWSYIVSMSCYYCIEIKLILREVTWLARNQS